MNHRLTIGLLIPTALALWLVQWRHDAALDTAKQAFRDQGEVAAQRVDGAVESAFRTIYQGLRTIARLPGVRKIDRHAENFGEDAKRAVQELYNLLAVNVAMSEVYIVPRDLDPERTDPVTNAPEAPIVTFDEMIVEAKADAVGAAEAEGPEETEIHEYRLMRQQLAWFERNTPNAASVHGLEVPAITGPEVITCDNSRFDVHKPDDQDRSGIIYSVPFFRPDGELGGMISGIVLTHVLRDLLPAGEFALRNVTHGLTATSHDDGVCHTSLAAIEQCVADPALTYSAVHDLEVCDPSSKWQVWTGKPDSAFWARDDVRAAEQMRWLAAVAVLLLAAAAGYGLAQLAARRVRQQRDREALEERQRLAEEQRAALEAQLQASERARMAAETMVRTAESIAASTQDLSTTSHRMGRSAEAAAVEAGAVSAAANEMTGTVEQLSRGVRELGASIGEIASSAARAVKVAEDASARAESTSTWVDRLSAAVDRIQGVIELIDDVASQTNLLALNATIEAARAGDAGKGFGVVAHEVKELANETAQATKRIETEVTAIRESAAGVITAMRSIRETIRGICDGQSSIAGAVEQQSATSKVMDRNLTAAAKLVAGIAQRIQGLADAATVTRDGVGQTESAVAGLERMVQTLRSVGAQLNAK